MAPVRLLIIVMMYMIGLGINSCQAAGATPRVVITPPSDGSRSPTTPQQDINNDITRYEQERIVKRRLLEVQMALAYLSYRRGDITDEVRMVIRRRRSI